MSDQCNNSICRGLEKRITQLRTAEKELRDECRRLTAELATAREEARTAEAQALKGEEKG